VDGARAAEFLRDVAEAFGNPQEWFSRGNGFTDAPAGSLRNVYLVGTDLAAARRRLLERGVDVGEIRHKTPIGAWDGGLAPGLDPRAETMPASPISPIRM
jgi:hypothetical protein